MTDAALVYVTAATEVEARKIAETVVRERLAACANILGAMTSIFFWEGAAQSEPEHALVLKTSITRLPALTERIKALHAYDEPCVIALPIIGGSADFIDWIKRETGAD